MLRSCPQQGAVTASSLNGEFRNRPSPSQALAPHPCPSAATMHPKEVS